MRRKLRIAVFAHEFPALSETFVLNQVTGLIDLGHDVTVFALGPRDEPTRHPDFNAYGLTAKCRYRAMPRGRASRFLGLPQAIVRRLRHGAMPLLRALNAIRYGREAGSLSLLYWTAATLPERRFDVLHCHFGSVARGVAYLREIGAINGRLVTTFHGVDVSADLERDARCYDHLFAHGDLFLPISDFWRRRLERHGMPAARTTVHRMGVDPRRFSFHDRAGPDSAAVRLLMVGRMVEKKGHAYALAALAALAPRAPVGLGLEFIGDGPLRPRLEAQCRALGIGARVTFHGWRDQSFVAERMNESHILVAPSVTDAAGDMEGIPVTIMEAMATGMPVVSTWHSAIPEIIEHERSGILVKERDATALASALEQLMTSPDTRARLARAARHTIERSYDIRRLNRRLAGLFDSTLAPQIRVQRVPVAAA